MPNNIGQMISLLVEGNIIVCKQDSYMYRYNHERRHLECMNHDPIYYGREEWRFGNGDALGYSGWKAYPTYAEALHQAQEWHGRNTSATVEIPAAELEELKRRKAELEAATIGAETSSIPGLDNWEPELLSDDDIPF